MKKILCTKFEREKRIQINLNNKRETSSKYTWTRLRTSLDVMWSKYDIGERRAAASTILTISGWVKAANDIIVPWEIGIHRDY